MPHSPGCRRQDSKAASISPPLRRRFPGPLLALEKVADGERFERPLVLPRLGLSKATHYQTLATIHWRQVRDSNPHRCYPSSVFKTGAIANSANLPKEQTAN